jgi:hypothetical protein
MRDEPFWRRLLRRLRRAPLTEEQAELLAKIKFPCC